ncbi:site-specific integrase [Chitinolyticbacter meiyuanensis]|uniref:site-specific integrase n=1 Tax=Chitinolyticbacter meiyuanensis TaxID=682798 RepID=UPI0011E5B121|nr:site-specific integrase [Chitinolyticbacter meiyuanensis]
MSQVDLYLEAAERDNTRRSYESAVRHFEVEWKGLLPATPDSIARYLADYAGELATSTLKQRLAALAKWHQEQGFPDPTKATVVRKVLKGIQMRHPMVAKQAHPLQLEMLTQAVQWLDAGIVRSQEAHDVAAERRLVRDKALLLLGFWRGFRGEELTRIAIDFVVVVPGKGLQIFLPYSKADRQATGRTFKVPALATLCPVAAYEDWISLSGLKEGPVFRAVDRHGNIRSAGLHANSLIPILRQILSSSGVDAATTYSGHSLRRGFANWAAGNGWDLKTLMKYVGWRDVASAMRYIDASDVFAMSALPVETNVRTDPLVPLGAAPLAMESTTAPPLAAAPAPLPPRYTLEVEATIKLARYNSQVRGQPQAQRLIEEICLAPHRMTRLDKEGTKFRLLIEKENDELVEEEIYHLIDEMYRIADNHHCFLEVRLHDRAGGRYWS